MPKCTADTATCNLIGTFIAVIVNPILVLMASVAVLVFVWGVVQYMRALYGGDKDLDGRRHMGYGLIGLFVIVSTIAILNIIASTVKGLLP